MVAGGIFASTVLGESPPSGLKVVATPDAAVQMREVDGAVGSAKTGRYIVRLEEQPLALYRGNIVGLDATHPGTRGERRLDVGSQASVAYVDYLRSRQATVLAQAEVALGRRLEPSHSYRYAFNGFAVPLTTDEARQMARIPGVAAVTPESQRRITTDAGPAWIGAPAIWDGAATGGLPGTFGEGIIVGIVDSGIWPDHPSFADIGGDGYDHTNPRGAGSYVGACDPGDPSYVPSFVCNDKLIGAWDYEDGPGDTNGHGSHVASTAAGNVLFSMPLMAPTITLWFNVSGVAPHANLISYDVCNAAGSCAGAAMIAGIDQAVADGVDVINFSIGGGPSYPWGDPESLAFLAAHGAGIFVATSAGNSGPGPGTVGSPADAPWVTAVAAATHHRL
jgi:subtilisin family serine protease